MKKAAQADGVEVSIEAKSLADAKKEIQEANIVLLGPQIRYELENVKSDLQKKYLEENFPEQYPAGYFEREDQTGKNAQEITA